MVQAIAIRCLILILPSNIYGWYGAELMRELTKKIWHSPNGKKVQLCRERVRMER